MKRGKKYNEAIKLIDKTAQYEVADACALVKKTAVAKFDETIEAHFRMGLDGRHADQQIRGAVVLPHGTGKKVRVLVFAKGPKVQEAEAAGADYVGGDELIPKIQNDGWFEFDVVVATPDMMGVVGRLGRNSITTRKLRVEGRGRNFMVSMTGFVPVIAKVRTGFSA